VLVLGLGVMGMMHVAAAAARRAEVIIAADRVPHRLRQARGFGATAAVNVDTEPVADRVAGLTDGAGADLVIVGPGSPEAMQLGLSCTAAGGTLLLFSGTPAEAVWPLRPAEVFFREVRVVPSFSAGPADTRAALSALTPPHGWLSAAGHVERLLTHAFPLSRWEAAFDLSARSAEALQVVLRP
jgi:L-iditol 2-dehydrogenase